MEKTTKKKAKGTRSPQLRVNSPGGSARERLNSIDPYGFERAEDFDYEAYEERMSEYLAVLTRRAIKWSKLLTGRRRVERNLKMKRYVRKGVPNEHRGVVWMACSGAREQLEKHPGYYPSLLTAHNHNHNQDHNHTKLLDAIRTDLNRTFPDNVQFRKSSEACLQGALYNVLRAYGQHNPDIGYCQGMNFIAGYLLIVTRDEEKSFWLMDALLGRIIPDYHTPGMLGLQTDQAVLGELVRARAPGVGRAMGEHGVMWTLVVSRWFLCLYIDVLPVETVLRIWDCLFYEGSKILFRVALTLIRHGQDPVQEAESLPDVCDAFKRISRGPYVEDCHTFMQRIFTEPGNLSMATITKLRESCRARVLAEEP